MLAFSGGLERWRRRVFLGPFQKANRMDKFANFNAIVHSRVWPTAYLMTRQYKSLYGNQNKVSIHQNTSDLWMLKFGTDVQRRMWKRPKDVSL